MIYFKKTCSIDHMAREELQNAQINIT